jgi:hypothetical protein
MTQREVIAVLGEPGSRYGPSTNSVLGFTIVQKEFWQYYSKEWFSLFGPADDAYVVYFSADQKVTSLRKPKKK